ncbi:MAG: hypothetical protein DI535_14315 [Citrobacter freundii]|nr:MAG: hypothetical protein DI535_14315 [Citrobacter freundii]
MYKLLYMFRQFKYDLAFSFAEEDRSVAEAIASAFKARKLTNYYLYTEQESRQWGKDLFQITLDVYRNSRFVLMICSKDFIRGYWSGIEQRAMMSAIRRIEGRILPLRTDETKLTDLPESIVYQRWYNDPETIARFIASRVREDKAKARKLKMLLLGGFAISGIAFFYQLNGDGEITCPIVDNSSIGDPIMIRWNAQQSILDSNSNSVLDEDTFYLSNTEVTVRQYKEFCKHTKIDFPSQPFPQLDNNPIVNVSWDEAQAFCRWRNGRLPSDEEWTYAASAGLDDKYSGGNNAGKVAVYGGLKKFKSVGRKCPNALGIYDMSGNVAEWTATSMDSSNQFKIVKGGSYKDATAAMQVSVDSAKHHTARSPTIGFRIAWDQKPSK